LTKVNSSRVPVASAKALLAWPMIAETGSLPDRILIVWPA